VGLVKEGTRSEQARTVGLVKEGVAPSCCCPPAPPKLQLRLPDVRRPWGFERAGGLGGRGGVSPWEVCVSVCAFPILMQGLQVEQVCSATFDAHVYHHAQQQSWKQELALKLMRERQQG